MKTFLTILIVAMPITLFAQTAGQKSGERSLMKVIEDVKQCMEKIDRTELEKVKARAEEEGEKIKALCREGKRDKAQAEAVALSKELAKSPVIAEMQKCSEKAADMLPGAIEVPSIDETFDGSHGHVCDNIEE